MPPEQPGLPEGIAGLYGFNAPSALAAIRERAQRWKTGAREPDGRKLALVFEGGAMRAAAPAGGAVALGHLGLADVFDEVYATSAGVINASYFLAGQGDMGITIYFEDLTTGRFINPLRFWKIVDVDYVIEEVAVSRKPLDVQKVLDSPTRFYATVMDAATGQARMVDTKTTKEPLLNVVKAALSIPVLYNRTVPLEGRRCMDGGLHIPFPLQQAIDNGCTDILVLLSRTHDFLHMRPVWWERMFFGIMCARGRRALNELYSTHHHYSRVARDLALGRAPGAPPHVNIATLCASPSEGIHRTSVDPARLRAASVSYGRRVLGAFGVDASRWDLGPASSVAWPVAVPRAAASSTMT